MLSNKRFEYVKGLLDTAGKALDGFTLSKEQFDKLSPINQKLWTNLTSFESEAKDVVPVSEVTKETPDANV